MDSYGTPLGLMTSSPSAREMPLALPKVYSTKPWRTSSRLASSTSARSCSSIMEMLHYSAKHAPTTSLDAQCLHRLNHCGSVRRHIAGYHGRRHQHRRHGAIRCRIERTHFE